jgi:membrane-bound ClpP family serine protease
MTLLTISLLILFGLLLIVAEVVLIPGTSVVGIIGGAMCALGMAGSFLVLPVGWAIGINLGTLGIAGSLVVLAFRSKTWKKFEVKGAVTGKAPQIDANFTVGARGTTLTPCNPIGIARFGNKEEEVYAQNGWIDTGMPIEIVDIKNNTITILQTTNS